MRKFILRRTEDVSGVSGVGVVAEGVMFGDGTCVLRWLTEYRSTAIYANIVDLKRIHEHGGKTAVVWEADAEVDAHTPGGFTGPCVHCGVPLKDCPDDHCGYCIFVPGVSEPAWCDCGLDKGSPARYRSAS